MADIFELSRRYAESSDLEFLFQLRKKTSLDVILAQFGEWNEHAERRLVENLLERECEILELDGNDIGMIVIKENPNSLFLYEIQIMPDQQGKGIGTQIINELKDQAAVINKPLELQVLKKNTAFAFYMKLGFENCGETVTHINMVFKPKAND